MRLRNISREKRAPPMFLALPVWPLSACLLLLADGTAPCAPPRLTPPNAEALLANRATRPKAVHTMRLRMGGLLVERLMCSDPNAVSVPHPRPCDLIWFAAEMASPLVGARVALATRVVARQGQTASIAPI